MEDINGIKVELGDKVMIGYSDEGGANLLFKGFVSEMRIKCLEFEVSSESGNDTFVVDTVYDDFLIIK